MGDRRRSWWGWGFEDAAPDPKRVAGLARQLETFFGAHPGAPAQPVSPEEIPLPVSRLRPPPAVSPFVSSDRAVRLAHTYGRAFPDQVRAFSGDFTNAPDWVALPRDEAQVEATLEWAATNQMAVVPYGGGTGVVGGVECPRDRAASILSLDLRRLNRVMEVDTESLSARIQAGATGPVLEEQLGREGLSLRFFPQSFELSTLGGWLATRAGGHFATVYTHVDDLAQAVRMITPTGAWASRRLPASGAGPSPDRLALGSEGILGVITEAWMRVFRRPRFRSSASVLFAELDAAVDAVREVVQARLYPANCRLLDPLEAMMNRVASDGSSVVVLGFESADASRAHWLERALAICASHQGRCPDGPRHREDDARSVARDDAAGAWRRAFFEGPYLQSALITLGAVVDTFETACTWDRFSALHADVRGSVTEALQQTCGGGVVTCRFTHVYPDGPAPYYTFIAPGRSRDRLEQHRAIKEAACDALLRNGGTITHHHAVGRTHRPWYDRQRPEPFARALRAAKAAVDPSGILNPGVLID